MCSLEIQTFLFLQTSIEYLFTRISELGLDLQLGRDKQTNKRNNVERRIYLENNSLYSDLDLVGLIEKAQSAFLPLRLAVMTKKNIAKCS
jgi:hypothetical protein